MNKKFFPLTVFIILASFFFISSVSANTYTYSLSDANFTYLDSPNFWKVKNYADNFISTSATFKSYKITFYNNIYYVVFLFGNVTGNGNYAAASRQFQYKNTCTTLQSRTDTYDPSTDTFSTGSVEATCPNSPYNGTSTGELELRILYANYTFPYLSGNDFIFNYLDTTYTFGYNDPSHYNLPTLYDLYIYKYPDFSPPIPDRYPLLTQFYDLFIEKINLLCEFIYSSYLILSIFVVFILFYVLLLLRRLK